MIAKKDNKAYAVGSIIFVCGRGIMNTQQLQCFVYVAESVLLAKCGYGMALLPEFYILPDDKMAVVPIADTKNIEYGIYYRSTEKHVRFFMDEYRRAVEAL